MLNQLLFKRIGTAQRNQDIMGSMGLNPPAAAAA